LILADNRDGIEDRDFESDFFCPECGELVHLISEDGEDEHRDGHRTTIRMAR